MKAPWHWTPPLTFPRLETWPGFLAAVVVGVLGITGFDYLTKSGGPTRGEQALTSFQDAALVVGSALLVGLTLWLCIRVWKGRARAPEPKEFVLWLACIFAVGVAGMRMLHAPG